MKSLAFRKMGAMIFVCSVLLLTAIAIEASDGFRIVHGSAAQSVTAHDVCQKITNNSSTNKDVYIPTTLAEEWLSFRTNPPEGVTLAACTPEEPFVADDSNPCVPTSYTVPAGVTTLFVQLWGAGGGASGGYTQGYLSVTPGETLTLMPGQSGQATSGDWALSCGGGGGTYSGTGGGGRSAIRRGSTELMTAGGGGGPGWGYSSGTGGLGGGLSGSDGYAIPSCNTTPGRGGTQTAGGAGGNANFDGVAGAAFQGGNGGVFVNSKTNQPGSRAGGGGGGGYFGGGGGGAYTSNCSVGDGGGGGAGYCGGPGVTQCVSYTGYGANKRSNGRVSVIPLTATPTSTVFNSTGADQTYTVPADTTTLLVQIWGAGALGGHYTGDRYSGSNGGYTQGYLAVTPGETLTVIAGKAGAYKSASKVYGGGGGSSCGAGGGGRSAIRRGSTELMTAGGAGGGKGGSSVAGGAGGGTGENGSKCDPGSNPPAQSGSNGGAGEECTTTTSRWGEDGSAFTGGDGGPYGTHKCGGGGGGGYFGGGGGGGSGSSDYSGSGGGGTGYCGGEGVDHCTTLNGLGAYGGLADGVEVIVPAGDGRVILTPIP